METELTELVEWFNAQCNGDWEHGDGVKITTLDNPGWSILIDLDNTDLEDREFTPVEDLAPERDWMRCWIEKGQFHAAGGPDMLRPMLRVFLDWATTESETPPWLRPNEEL